MTIRAPFALLAAALALPAPAANTWFFQVEYSDPAGVINSPDDTARVTLWAHFDDNLYAFCAGALSVVGDDDTGVWSSIERLLKGPGTKNGAAMGGSVYDIVTGQLHFPDAGIFADTSNPIRAWTAVWQTENLYSRTVGLSTATTRYDVYVGHDGTSKGFLDTVTEGNGLITVVPGPGAAPLVGAALLAWPGRPRRRTTGSQP